MSMNDKIDLPLLSSVAIDVLENVRLSFEKNQKLTDGDLLKLHAVYGTPFERALELIDRKCVTFFKSSSGSRCVVQVIGSTGVPYCLFHRVNYCPCPAYKYNVIQNKTYLTCKHVLVAYLAELLGKGRWVEVTDHQITVMLYSIGNLGTEICYAVVPPKS